MVGLSSLFGDGAQGFTFEPWDITTLYQDRAGTTPVTAAGQSVGYRRDKSGRGNHEVAINDAARGIYGREPKGGTRTRCTVSEPTKAQLVNSTGISDAGTTITGFSASLAFPGGTVGNRIAYRDFGALASTQYTLSCYIQMDDNGTPVPGTDFTIVIGNVSSGGSYATPVDVGGNVWRVARTLTSGTVSLTNTGVFKSDALSTRGFRVSGFQLEAGASVTAYQKAVSAYDITEAGVASCYYVQPDGVDDAYVTPTITPGTDKAQVFMALKKLGTGATAQIIAEMSVTRAANNGAFTVGVPGSVSGLGAFLVSRGTVDATAQVTTGYTPPTHVVLSGLTDISGDVATLRANGSQIAQAVTDQGTGNFLAYPAYLYARGGTTQPFNGRDYGHVVRFGPNLDAATIARVESLLARNTPEVTL